MCIRTGDTFGVKRWVGASLHLLVLLFTTFSIRVTLSSLSMWSVSSSRMSSNMCLSSSGVIHSLWVWVVWVVAMGTEFVVFLSGNWEVSWGHLSTDTATWFALLFVRRDWVGGVARLCLTLFIHSV